MEFYRELNSFTVYKNDSNRLASDYTYKYALPFERIEDPEAITVFLQMNWMHTLTISVLYYAIVRGMERYLKDRPAFSLKAPLQLWNGALAVFSILGFVRFSEDLFLSLYNHGVYRSICYSVHPNDVAAFWSLLFAISKIVELGDTLFIVLRKKPLIFLHYYHHAAVLIYTVHSGAEHTAPGRAFISMNYLAHSFMYTYYAVAAAGVRVPRWISMTVTTIQTTQMLAGVGISIAVYRIKSIYDWPCQQSYPNLYLAFLIYFTFAVLFIQFFYNAYFARKSAAKAKKIE
ncbi:hypothetical protein PENTCL1PPCAC_10635 [Pristionchus entomophagus]|uniref:Elongation of very long chain fatty acids protein n=1 Tax=Pristionchus entomophagus TaxID=358040 RepID=A0AAV5SZ52_9BILA|nr:hypothetical protein PENTCL1PPCAC_10635 [Pristionchus entomophagus]